MQITAREVEREHRTQVKRWKKKRGEPSRKASQRMHSARAIMANEPHTRQDLRQKPTIIVQYPSIPEENSVSSLRKRKGSLKRNQVNVPNIANPYALSNESKLGQILETQPPNEEDGGVVPPSPPSYPPPLPTQQEHQIGEMNNSSVSQKPVESLPMQHLSLLTPPADESPSQWRPHLLDSPPAQFPDPVPAPAYLPNNKENSAVILDPPTDSSRLLTLDPPADEGSTAPPEDKKDALRKSTESINSSEDTYL